MDAGTRVLSGLCSLFKEAYSLRWAVPMRFQAVSGPAPEGFLWEAEPRHLVSVQDTRVGAWTNPLTWRGGPCDRRPPKSHGGRSSLKGVTVPRREGRWSDRTMCSVPSVVFVTATNPSRPICRFCLKFGLKTEPVCMVKTRVFPGGWWHHRTGVPEGRGDWVLPSSLEHGEQWAGRG